jgi:hypothetical protein
LRPAVQAKRLEFHRYGGQFEVRGFKFEARSLDAGVSSLRFEV